MKRRPVGLARTGLLATLGAVVATTAAAALATAAGIALEVPADGETIPLSGIAFVTGVFSLVGVVMAAALLRWSTRPDEHFVRTAVALTALSLVPWLVGAAVSASVTLAVLHLVAAAVMIPSLAAGLRGSGRRAVPEEVHIDESVS